MAERVGDGEDDSPASPGIALSTRMKHYRKPLH